MKIVQPTLTLSIVSHGHGVLIKDLLCDLNHLDFSDFSSVEVVLILNIPENEDYINHLNLK
ncbi:hypothetical protein, partial [Photobacterium lucens]